MSHHHHYDDRHCHQQQHNHFPPTSPPCCCRSCPPPPPCQSSSPGDPLIQALISHLLLQNPQNSHPYSANVKPCSTNNLFDFPPNLQTFHYRNQTRCPSQKRSKQKQCFGSRQHHLNLEEDDQLETPYSVLSSLFKRIDILESSLRQLSSSASFSLRDAAARTIQTHFRACLVRRSRSFRELKELASVKSSLGSLRSSISRRSHLDYENLSREAMNLLLKLDGIQGSDQLIRDTKGMIAREIAQYLELVDGVRYLERKKVTNRTCKIVRSSDHARVMYPKKAPGSKCRNVDKDKKKLIENLRERVERIRGFSGALEEDEENEGFDESDDSVGVINDEANRGRRSGNGASFNELKSPSNAMKRVCFVDGKNGTRVYGIDGSANEQKLSNGSFRCVDKTVHLTEDMEDDEEAESDGEESSQESIEEGMHSRGQKMGTNNERNGLQYQNGEPVFSAPMPVKMES